MGTAPLCVIAPQPLAQLCATVLTHDPHHNVTQNEEKEEDTADDICAAPGEGEGRLWRRELGVGIGRFCFLKKTFFSVGRLSSKL